MTRVRAAILVALRSWMLLTFLAFFGGLGFALSRPSMPSWLEVPWVDVEDFAVGVDGNVLMAVSPRFSRLQLYDTKGRFVRSSDVRGLSFIDSVSATRDGRFLVVTRDKGGHTEVDVLASSLDPIEHLRFDGWFVVLDASGRPTAQAPRERTGPPQPVNRLLGPGDGLGPAKDEGLGFTSADGGRWKRTLFGIRRLGPDGRSRTFHASWWLVPFSLPLAGALSVVALFAHHLPGLRAPVPREATPEEAWADHDRRAREAVVRLRWVKVGFALGMIPWLFGLGAMILGGILSDDAPPRMRWLLGGLVFLVVLLVVMNVPNMLRWAFEIRTREPADAPVPVIDRVGLPPEMPERILLRGFLKVLACAAAVPTYVLLWLFGFGHLADIFGHREAIMTAGFYASFMLVMMGLGFAFARINRLK